MADEESSVKWQDLALQEYIALRAEILSFQSSDASFERNIIGVIGIIWGFLFLHQPRGIERLAWFIPVPFVAVNLVRRHRTREHLKQFSTYIRRIEDAFFSGSSLSGWEHFFHGPSGFNFGRRWTPTGWLMLAATLAIALYEVIR